MSYAAQATECHNVRVLKKLLALLAQTRESTHMKQPCCYELHTHEASILLPVDQFGDGVLYRETPYGRSAPYPQAATVRLCESSRYHRDLHAIQIS